MSAAIEFFGVEWIGNNQPFLLQVGPIFGSLLVASVAAFAAKLAADTANERQQNQLAHDTERQREQLRHERELRDRDFLRNSITSALESVVTSIHALADFALKKKAAEEASVEATASEPSEKGSEPTVAHVKSLEKLASAMGKLLPALGEGHTASTAVSMDNVRLRAALGVDHPIVKAHRALADAHHTWYEALRAGDPVRTKEEKATIVATGKDVAPALHRFERACREEFDGREWHRDDFQS